MAKKLTKRAQKRKTQRDLMKDKNTKSIDSRKLLYTLKYSFNEIQTNAVLKSLSQTNLKKLRGNLFPKQYKDIRSSHNVFSNDDIIKELHWYTNELIDCKENINLFLKLADNLECKFLAGDYTEASQILERIDSDICVSHWGIEKALLIAEYGLGFKKNKEVLSNIINQENNPIVNLLSKYQSIRIEKNLSYFKYKEIFDNLIERHKNKNKVIDYLNYKLNYFNNPTYKHKGFILNVENSSSIIDRYESFINIILLLLSEKTIDTKIQEIIKKSLLKLVEHINDNRLIICLCSLNFSSNFLLTENNKKYLRILDLYHQGQYKDALLILKPFILEHPNVFELYPLYVTCCINIDDLFINIFQSESFAANSLEDIYNIYCKNHLTSSSIIHSHKTCNTIGPTSWSCKYFAFINNEYSNSFHEINITKLASLNSKFFTPDISILFNNLDSAINYLSCINQSENFLSSKFYKQICEIIHKEGVYNPPLEVTPFLREIYYGDALLISGRFDKALDVYNSILVNMDFNYFVALSHYRIELVKGIILCLINLKNYKEATVLIAKENIKNPNFIHKIRFDILLKKLIQSKDEEFVHEISTPIVLHQYMSYINSNYVNSNAVWVAYDNFLFSHNLNYPKELEGILDSLDLEKSIYFLRNICKQEIYDSSYLFENQDELDNERIEVCSLLIKIDKEHFESYMNEISEINRNILIRKGIKQIDESKIYVDIRGLKKFIENDIKESFNRSMNFLSLPQDQINKINSQKGDLLLLYYGEISETIEIDDTNTKISTFSAFQQFKEIFYKIRDEFISSNEFGLDTYLSMRIRHGTLLGEIRSVFENYHLITKKEDNSTNYQQNKYWEKVHLNSDIFLEFNKILASFSNTIDKLSDELKNKKLQIKTEKKDSTGFFDYTYEKRELLMIFREMLDTIDNHEDFIERVIDTLWQRTEQNLLKIRNNISEEIKNTMVFALMNLSKEIEVLIDKNIYIEINELIRNITTCQTDIANKLDKISSWFKRTNSKTINDFFINLPIDSTIITLRRLFKDYSSFSPILDINCLIKFEGEAFPHFCYIFQNLLHNIIEHSKLDALKLKIWLNIYFSENILNITLKNNFSEEINLELLNRKIENIHSSLKLSIDNDKIKAEEGTGYLKIQKTLKSDLGREFFEINIFTVDSNRIFITEIKLSLNNLLKGDA